MAKKGGRCFADVSKLRIVRSDYTGSLTAIPEVLLSNPRLLLVRKKKTKRGDLFKFMKLVEELKETETSKYTLLHTTQPPAFLSLILEAATVC